MFKYKMEHIQNIQFLATGYSGMATKTSRVASKNSRSNPDYFKTKNVTKVAILWQKIALK